MSIRHRQTQQPFPANGGWHLRLLLKLSKVITQSKPYNTLIIRITYMVTLDFYILGIIVDCLPEYLPVREAVATAPLHIVENVGDAIVYVLGRVAVVLGKERIFRRTLLQVHLYRSLEMFCSFHIAVVFISYTFFRFPKTRSRWLRNSPQNSLRCTGIPYRHGTT